MNELFMIPNKIRTFTREEPVVLLDFAVVTTSLLLAIGVNYCEGRLLEQFNDLRKIRYVPAYVPYL